MPVRRLLESTPIKLVVPALSLATIVVVALATHEPVAIRAAEPVCIQVHVEPPRHVQRFARPPLPPPPEQPHAVVSL